MELPIELPELKILAEVGRGATYVVYRAQDLRIDRLVAVKMLLLGPVAERQDRAARFLREARVLAAVTPHPKIPAIHAVREGPQGQLYYTQEFVEGATLKNRVAAGAIRASEAASVLTGIEAALARVHQQGIVHRNLQPENVLVATDGSAKLVGFGRATAVDAVISQGAFPVEVEADLAALQNMREWLRSATA